MDILGEHHLFDGCGRSQRMARAGFRARGLALVVLAALLPSEPAWACTCVSVFGPETLKHAAAVFVGRATTVEFLEPDEEAKEPPILVTFDVSEIWKGPERKRLRLRTTYNKWTCAGYYFKEGETYLVTAFKAGSGRVDREVELARVNICGGTRELGRAQDILRVLGPGKKPPDEDAKRVPRAMLGVTAPSNSPMQRTAHGQRERRRRSECPVD